MTKSQGNVIILLMLAVNGFAVTVGFAGTDLFWFGMLLQFGGLVVGLVYWLVLPAARWIDRTAVWLGDWGRG